MQVSQKLEAELPSILESARLAPSVHNTQPWKLSIKDSSVIISIDERIDLKYSDPTGRETYISLGIFTEAFMLAAASRGLSDGKIALEGSRAKLEFKLGPVARLDKELAALARRSTDRSIYKPVDIPPAIIKEIEGIDVPGVRLRVVTDRQLIETTAGLTAKGIGLALSNPDFRKELSRYLIRPWSGKKRGISTGSLALPTPLAVMEPWFIRIGAGLRKEVKVEQKRWLSASGVVFVITSGDITKDWFAAGRAYLRASLAIERAGLSQATSAATVEASTFHEDVEDMLKTNQRLQCVIRIGRGLAKRHSSPRLSAEDLLAT